MKRALSIAIALFVAACSNQTAPTTTTTETTTTTVPPTTTTTEMVTTTTLPPATTTTTLLPADPVEVEVLRSQAHDVVWDFVNRVSWMGPKYDRKQLSASDPFGGVIRSVLLESDFVDSFVRRCAAAGTCDASPYGAPLSGFPEALYRAGEGPIVPLGDGSYYVSGVYASGVQYIWHTYYVGGFRFRVEDGRAILEDLVAWDWAVVSGKVYDTERRGIWLSERNSPENVSGVTVDFKGLDVKRVVASGKPGGARALGVDVMLELTNPSTTERARFQVEGGSVFGWLQPGETGKIIFRGTITPSDLGGTIVMKVSNRETGAPWGTITVQIPDAKWCNSVEDTNPETLKPGDCIRIDAIAREHGFINHENY